MELVVGTKRWSTWSLRPWLALKHTGATFTETLVGLRQDEGRTEAAILPHSPSGLVPVLKDGGLTVWDSLAICEYLAEKFPAAKLWPDDPAMRAMARAAASEMHSGFQSLRGECPMALEAEPKVTSLSEATQKNVRRIVALWSDLLGRSGGPFLAGEWSIADAFYTPVATRFRTYGVHLSDYGDDGTCGAYATRLLATPEFREWEAAARAET
ncbi:glutathione S-transferase family protein [Phenylobacterium sp. NIBR 498073]|uniref:glutathione S-transferase family protein n=1 Tax=Phenylobacterium sp. NIBR 498073 TaxID=3015177 RepID=UPI0022B5D5FF|nr:glutathione S-transferase family protein [Phenylobacterium sp. NIBR 498073]MBS0490489.1 glutathione S-transferase family protein [Pseudomonadota bacterium]WGU39212.1 glutathione S-transferase family protein [Phenylobacterium sp. NIBR 498073]